MNAEAMELRDKTDTYGIHQIFLTDDLQIPSRVYRWEGSVEGWSMDFANAGHLRWILSWAYAR